MPDHDTDGDQMEELSATLAQATLVEDVIPASQAIRLPGAEVAQAEADRTAQAEVDAPEIRKTQ